MQTFVECFADINCRKKIMFNSAMEADSKYVLYACKSKGYYQMHTDRTFTWLEVLKEWHNLAIVDCLWWNVYWGNCIHSRVVKSVQSPRVWVLCTRKTVSVQLGDFNASLGEFHVLYLLVSSASHLWLVHNRWVYGCTNNFLPLSSMGSWWKDYSSAIYLLLHHS